VPRITIQRVMAVVALLAVGLVALRNPPEWPGTTKCGPKCPANLRSVAVALLVYEQNNQLFPTGTYRNTALAYDDRLSWYAKIMPHLDMQEMHDQVMWDEPWNDGINKKLSRILPGRAQCTNQDSLPSGQWPSSYIGIAGIGTDAPLLPNNDPRAGVFGYDRVTSLADIKDGTSNTMFLAETSRVSGSWLQGGPATVRGLDPAQKPYLGPNRQFGGMHRGGAWVAMADGSVRWVRDSLSPTVFEALSTMAGGETLPSSW
jgi:hypothetical protein